VDPSRIVTVLILAFALYAGWSFLHGGRGRVSLYAVAACIAVSLFGALPAAALRMRGAVEALTLAAISLSLAALASTPGLWEAQLRAAREHARVYQRFRPRDFLSWRGWLKVVDRIGARSAAMGYFGVFALGTVGQLLVAWLSEPQVDRPFFLVALLAPLLFSVVSAIWVYRAVRRVLPGA